MPATLCKKIQFFHLHFLCFLLVASASDLSTDRAALLALRSAVGGRTRFWNTSSTSPCNWQGVLCANGRVVALRLPAASLSGVLPDNTVSDLTALRTLSLRFNRLSGPLPSDLSKLSELRNLYLQGNQFSDSVPDSVLSLHSLVRLNLASNNFSGEIPSGFNDLTHLRTLYLENNRFNGILPRLELPNLAQFNVSFNSLTGSVPRGLDSNPKEAFLGTSLCGKPLDNACLSEAPANSSVEAPNLTASSRRKKLSGGAIAGIVIGSIVGFIFLLLVLLILCRKRSGSRARSVDIASIKNQETEARDKAIAEPENSGLSVTAAASAAFSATENPKPEYGASSSPKNLVFFRNTRRVFDLELLLRASAEVLGKGTFSTAYKAVLETGTTVVVKRLKDVNLSEREFKKKTDSVGDMNHENLLPVLAYYYSGEEKLLVYDYMPVGSLSALLHGNKGAGSTPLNWGMRISIALGTARGIEYLHFQGPNVSHGNIKSSNILLTKSFDPRVSDFGLNQLVGPPSSPTRISGYRAPEVTDPQRVSQKADVYSFGVLLLELITGKAPTFSVSNEDGFDLPRWVHSVVREDLSSEVFDIELLQHQKVGDGMVQLLQLGIECTAQFPDKRPVISEVAKRIEEIKGSSSIGHSDRVSETSLS